MTSSQRKKFVEALKGESRFILFLKKNSTLKAKSESVRVLAYCKNNFSLSQDILNFYNKSI